MTEQAKEPPPAGPKWRRRFKRWSIKLGVTLCVLAVLGATLVGVAEHHTSQPQFCASCHIMEPYYDTWRADLHGGKLEIACVECHYAPGERTTLNAKLRGLSQVTSYFSGRYGATRPRPHVANDSCLTSKCHGDMKFMDKSIQLGTVLFKHAKHLGRTADDERPIERRLADLRDEIREQLGDDARLAELEAAANEAGPANERYDRLVSLAREWNADVGRHVLIEFSQLLHRGVRLAQLADLQCTSCHSYHSPTVPSPAAAPDHHFQVRTTTCFTCHFNNEGFNTGTNTCLMCHSPPTTEIVVHKGMSPEASARLNAPELAAKPVKMNHTDILAQQVDCIACHADVARDDSTVTRRDCERCHDQPRFFADWKEPFTIDLVASYHKAHVKQQRAKCLDCHSEIKHKLVHDEGSPDKAFLATVLSDCTHCHANPHTDQVKLLLGLGGLGVPKSEPNPMFGARTNCFGCHTEPGVGDAGGHVMKGTQETCVACHGERYGDMFEQWKTGVSLSLTDAETAYQTARKVLDENTTASPAGRAKAAELLALAAGDLQMVKHGNGIHNVTYAMELLDSVTARCQKAIAALGEK